MAKDRVSASCSIEKLVYMKVSGRVTRAVAVAWSDIQTETDTRASFSAASHTARAFTLGRMARCTKASGPAASKRARASGKVSMVTRTSASGASQRPLDMVCTCGRMETGTKASGRIASSMAKELIYLPMATVSQEPISWVNQRVKASTNGRISAST